MKRRIAISAMMIGLAALATPTLRAQSPTRDGVFIHVSHGLDDPHRVLMALQMADRMSPDKDVPEYFDIKGIDVVLKDQVADKNAFFAFTKGRILSLDYQSTSRSGLPGTRRPAQGGSTWTGPGASSC